LGRNISQNTGTISGNISRTPGGPIPGKTVGNMSGTTTTSEGLCDVNCDQQYMKVYMTTFARDKDEKETKMEEDN